MTTMTDEKTTSDTESGARPTGWAQLARHPAGIKRLLAERLLAARLLGGRAATTERAAAQGEKQKAAPSGPVLWAIPLRVVTLLGYYMILTATVTGLIPMVGMWVHQQSGLPMGEPTREGLVAFWLMPYAFVVLMILVGELALFRAMWRGGSNLIAAANAKRDGDSAAPATGTAARTKTTTTTRKVQPGKNTTRSK